MCVKGKLGSCYMGTRRRGRRSGAPEILVLGFLGDDVPALELGAKLVHNGNVEVPQLLLGHAVGGHASSPSCSKLGLLLAEGIVAVGAVEVHVRGEEGVAVAGVRGDAAASSNDGKERVDGAVAQPHLVKVGTKSSTCKRSHCSSRLGGWKGLEVLWFRLVLLLLLLFVLVVGCWLNWVVMLCVCAA